jgi:Ca2+-binding EF-hand superfamily protein
MTREEALRQLALEEVAREELEQEKKQYAPSVEEMEQAKAAVEPTTGEALSAGVVEGIPFLKDAVAAYDGIADAVEEDNFSMDQAYANYKDKLDETNQDLSNVQEQSPWTMAAGEIAGTAASLAGGSAALKAAGAGATLTQAGINVASATGVGAAQQLSRSRDRGVSDVVVGGALGGISEIGGQYLMRGVKKTGKYLMDKADDELAASVKKIVGLKSASGERRLYKHLQRTNQKESEFLNDVLTQKLDDGTTVLDFNDATPRMIDKIKVKKNDLNDQLTNAYKSIDMDNDVKISIEDLKSSLSDDVTQPFLQSDDPGMQQIGLELDEYISSLGKKIKGVKREVTEEGTKLIEDVVYEDTWNISRVWKLQKDIRRRIESIYSKNKLSLDGSKEQQRRVATSLGKHMDEVLDTVSTKDNQVLGNVKKLRKQYGNIATVQDSLEQTIKGEGSVMDTIKEAFGFRGVLLSTALTPFSGPAAYMAAPAINSVLSNPKTPMYLAKGLKGISSIVNAAPTGEIASRLNTAAIMNNDRFSDTLYGTIAEINLRSFPLERSADTFLERQKDIRHFLKMQQPTAVKDFDEVIDSGDKGQIAQFMDQVSKFPGAGKFFQPGIGIDGFVYSPEDKQQLELQLKQADIPGAQRIEMLNQLRSTGKVPNMEEIVEPQPMRHIPRAKKIQDY